MALTANEQELFDLAMRALPFWFRNDTRAAEFVGEAAKIAGAARIQSDYWLGEQALILTADGIVGLEPDWLNQHALDRGTSRQEGESDAALRQRIRNVPDALTRPFLLTAVADVVEAAGEPTTGIAMVELPRDQAFLVDNVVDTGGGGTFTGPVSSEMTFDPDSAFARVPFGIASPNGRNLKHMIEITLASSGGNNGLFEITSLDGGKVVYTNAAGVAGADGGMTWETRRRNSFDAQYDGGRRDAYYGRGYRIGRKDVPTIITILPFGCTEPTRKSVAEMLRQKKGAGVVSIVECRAIL